MFIDKILERIVDFRLVSEIKIKCVILWEVVGRVYFIRREEKEVIIYVLWALRYRRFKFCN